MAAFAFVGVAAPVIAQAIPKLEPVAVAVIDFRGVLSKSEAAKGIRKIIDTRREEFRSQFAQIEKQLREEQQALAQQRPIITADAFEQRAQNLQGRVRQAQLEAQRSNQQLKRGLDKAMDTVQKSLFRVVAELAEESGAGIVLFRNSIVIAVKNLEISQEALKRLNASLSKVEVIFEPPKK
ncbi:MAG: OmpH family outer membrane protein [Alphaproteobacteria bacterium]|nr:OmpH family outer membrane protein [Alphaproteobacteria bacterium]